MDQLKYPIGTFSKPLEADKMEREKWIGDLKQAPASLRSAVAGLNEDQLDTAYRIGGWTVRQVVHHLADSHMNGYIRIKLALTEEAPLIRTFDEQNWAGLADARTLDPDLSLALLNTLHLRWAALFKSLTEADFEKVYVYPGTGEEMKLYQALALYVWHSHHHIAHITALRKRMGWN
ncbi:YfiT family bacillithiol transferase [Bacillus haynesii]|uniref:YfiT family bacillithiol transferase n=1 Tax=Bacillus haynesii TaxID=1925021 RepID=UPI00228185FE|nr:bacillithiol transferase BstA [Bacillus haynesii]MCY8225864.1 bacillithiol transferase BstA [Bacillus haynesii]